MIIIPAIDLKNGRCVRLLQGKMDSETVFSDDPAAIARKWTQAGAELIHVIDLDGAFEKKPQNLESIKKIIKITDAEIEVGGGIRNQDTVKMFIDIGVEKVIIGTEAIRNPQFVEDVCRIFPNQIVVGIDAFNGMAAIEGWTEKTEIKAVDLAKRFENCGAAAINFTDIHRDGMQTGPNIEETKKLAQSVSIPVIASGGVSSLSDIINLLAVEEYGVAGVITGRALYSGTLDLKQAIETARGNKK